ncbi:MAG: hypothetical protein EA399_10060 [Desulfovibrionales bacterium]|nr:MAG: hypothetical protein EA399_10060 [Desulfovibrionales bacterium]
MTHDSGCKLLFSHPQMVHDLLGGASTRDKCEIWTFPTWKRFPSYVADHLLQGHDGMFLLAVKAISLGSEPGAEGVQVFRRVQLP